MRQFVSWQWWLTIVVLVGAGALLAALVGAPGGDDEDEVAPVARRLDLIGVPETVDVSDDWQFDDGSSQGRLEVVLDGRLYRIAPGTPGENSCDDVRRDCALLADRLGDAVVWLTLQPVDPATREVRLPAIELPLDGVTWARLVNGWELPLLSVVERRCGEETASFLDFLDTVGPGHITWLDADQREISAVECTSDP